LSRDRRERVLQLAAQHDLWVIEDDVYCDLTYAGSLPPSLFALDRGRRVFRIGSFSKILAPGLRLGWLLGPASSIDELTWSGLRNMSGGANPLLANALAEYCRAGRLEPHVATLRQVYRRRRDLALDTLARTMPAEVDWTRPTGGFFLWITLPAPLKAQAVVDAAAGRGLLLLPGDPFFAQAPTGQYLRLSFSYLPPEKIGEGIETLAALMGELLA
jgi:2-aminoadipate transaminase